MASCASIHGSPIGAFRHDLRERDVYRNEDIDTSRSHLNYVLSPDDHGRNSHDCMDYYKGLLSDVYYREGSTVTAAEWSTQAPADLAPERIEDFFRSTYEFLNHYHFGGDDTRCLLAAVHRDELGAEHLHYVFTFPEMENPKYTDIKTKFTDGARKVADKYDIHFSQQQLQDCYTAVVRYERRSDKARERETIQEIGRVLGLPRDDARWCFTRMRRLDSERFEKKLMPKDSFITRKFFNDFHPAYQKWMDEHGFECTVYKGGGGISLTVDQLKEITRQTGKTLDRGLSVEVVSGLINENSKLHERVRELEKLQDQARSHAVSRWDRSYEKEHETERSRW